MTCDLETQFEETQHIDETTEILILKRLFCFVLFFRTVPLKNGKCRNVVADTRIHVKEKAAQYWVILPLSRGSGHWYGR
jgi:hypothetical protein